MALTQAACHRLLGVRERAPLEEIRDAYRRLARRLHPDLRPDDPRAGDRFKEITAAYNVLTGRDVATPDRAQQSSPSPRPRPASTEDPTENARAWAAWRRRAEALRHRRTGPAPEPVPAPEPMPGSEPQPRVRPTPSTAGRFFERLRATLTAFRAPSSEEPWDAACSRRELSPRASSMPRASSITRSALRGRIFGRAPRPATGQVSGSDVTLRLSISVEQLFEGGQRSVVVTRAAACPSCATGGTPTCVCGGAGRIKVRERLRVTVPAGARAGARLRLAGKGTDGLAGRPSGDLFLELDPAVVPGFRRNGCHLAAVIDVDRITARNGGSVAVNGPRGALELSVPPRTRGGTRFALRGQGLPSWGAGPRGDLVLTVAVV